MDRRGCTGQCLCYRYNVSGFNRTPSGIITLKYNANGSLLWQDVIATPQGFALRVDTDAAGNAYVLGKAFVTNASGNTTQDIILIKYAGSGTKLWTRTIGMNDTSVDNPVSMVQATNGNIIVTGSATTFDKTVTNEYRTMRGVSPGEMTAKIVEAGAHIIGTNCGNGIAGMIPIVREIRSTNANVPILVHANAGMPVYKEGESIFPESPHDTASYVKELISTGANIIGGCCGTTPAHIQAIREKAQGNRTAK